MQVYRLRLHDGRVEVRRGSFLVRRAWLNEACLGSGNPSKSQKKSRLARRNIQHLKWFLWNPPLKVSERRLLVINLNPSRTFHFETHKTASISQDETSPFWEWKWSSWWDEYGGSGDTLDDWNPANQLRGMVVYPILFRVSYIPGGAGFQAATVVNQLFSVSKLL